MNMIASRPLSASQTKHEVVPEKLATVVKIMGPCRGHALVIGMLALSCATAESAEERDNFWEEFRVARQAYKDALAEKIRVAPFMGSIDEIAPFRKVIHGFEAELDELPERAADLTREHGLRLSHEARTRVLPAIYGVIGVLDRMAAADAEARMAQMNEKAAMVDGMLTEMARIGRMIGLISINASVEAARAGGESGRAFQVIAEEVRSLARQSSDVLERMKRRMTEDRHAAGKSDRQRG